MSGGSPVASLTPIQPGDIVEVDKKGRRFFAEVTGKAKGELKIRPITRETYGTATSHEVVQQYRKTKNSRRSQKTPGQSI
jgi:hypothetical protein